MAHLRRLNHFHRNTSNRSKLACIGEQIVQDLYNTKFIANNLLRNIRSNTHGKLQTLFCNLSLMVRLDILHHGAELKLPLLKGKLTRLQLREIKNIINDSIHIAATAFHQRQNTHLSRIRLHLFEFENITKNAIDRRTQFMGDIGHKFRLDFFCHLGFLPHLLILTCQICLLRTVKRNTYTGSILICSQTHLHRKAGTIRTIGIHFYGVSLIGAHQLHHATRKAKNPRKYLNDGMIINLLLIIQQILGCTIGKNDITRQIICNYHIINMIHSRLHDLFFCHHLPCSLLSYNNPQSIIVNYGISCKYLSNRIISM